MSRTVFILGAGASKLAGAPLMKEFIDVAENIPVSEEKHLSGDEVNSFKEIFEALKILETVRGKAEIDTNNLEEVFAAFEMARLAGRLGTFPPEKIQRLSNSMKKVIVRTLEVSVKYPVKNKNSVWPAPPYGDFVDLLKNLHVNEGGLSEISVITFNYDIALDFALYKYDIWVNYGLADGPKVSNNLKVYKLHGSLNWTKCESCGLVPWHIHDYFRKKQWDTFALPYLDKATIQISKHFNQFQHCIGKRVETEPVIVPPTWNKEYSQELASVWANASNELSAAENIIVIGYSLAPTDQFFKYLFTIGATGTIRTKRIWVFNPNTVLGVDVDERFKNLLGPTFRERYTFFKYTFVEAIKFLKEELAGLKGKGEPFVVWR